MKLRCNGGEVDQAGHSWIPLAQGARAGENVNLFLRVSCLLAERNLAVRRSTAREAAASKVICFGALIHWVLVSCSGPRITEPKEPAAKKVSDEVKANRTDQDEDNRGPTIRYLLEFFGSSPQSVGAFGVLAPSPQRTALRADARFSRGSALPAASPLPLPATHTCGILASEFAAVWRDFGATQLSAVQGIAMATGANSHPQILVRRQR